MTIPFKEIEAMALELPTPRRSELVHRLIVSLEGKPDQTPEDIAKTWQDEIGRRITDMEAGKTSWTAADEVMTRLHRRVSAAKANAHRI